MNKIQKGDEVIILTGKDKKKRGIVLSCVNKNYCIVENINLVTKHIKSNPKNQNPGGIIKKSMPIHISNIAIFNHSINKGDRISIKKIDGEKTRVFRSNGMVVGAKYDMSKG